MTHLRRKKKVDDKLVATRDEIYESIGLFEKYFELFLHPPRGASIKTLANQDQHTHALVRCDYAILPFQKRIHERRFLQKTVPGNVAHTVENNDVLLTSPASDLVATNTLHALGFFKLREMERILKGTHQRGISILPRASESTE